MYHSRHLTLPTTLMRSRLFSRHPSMPSKSFFLIPSSRIWLRNNSSSSSTTTTTTTTTVIEGVGKTAKVIKDFQHRQNERVEVGGFHINYIKVGHGPHVVFCFPGILGSMRSHLPHQLLNFNKDEFTLYAWDQPGYGLSRPPERIFTDDSLQEDADFLVQFMKMFGHEKYSVMGWSGGGCSALFLAIRYPQVVKKLVVWGAFSYVNKKDADNYKWFGNTENWGGTMKDVLVEEYGEEFFKKHFEMWMDLFARIYTHRAGDLCGKQLHRIKCPTLVIQGTMDGMVKPEHGKFIHENVRNSKLIMWNKGKHNMHLRHPDEFNAIVQKFLLEEEEFT